MILDSQGHFLKMYVFDLIQQFHCLNTFSFETFSNPLYCAAVLSFEGTLTLTSFCLFSAHLCGAHQDKGSCQSYSVGNYQQHGRFTSDAPM